MRGFPIPRLTWLVATEEESIRRAFARLRVRVRRYTQSKREAETSFYGYSPQPRSPRIRARSDQGSAIREKQRLERGTAFRRGGKQVHRRKWMGSFRKVALSVRHRG